jgi:cell division ATPase FtsA
MVQAALNGVDADLRSHLITRVVVTGGSTLINGFNDRLNFELQSMYTSSRVRIQAPASTVERKYASWIGGSILASLGSFHQVRSVGRADVVIMLTMCRCGFRRRSTMSLGLGLWKRGVNDSCRDTGFTQPGRCAPKKMWTRHQ